MTVIKGLKNNKTPGTYSVINEFFKYGGHEVRNKLLKIMIFEKEDVPKDFRKILIKSVWERW